MYPEDAVRGNHVVLLPNPLRRPADVRRYLDDPSAIRELGGFDYWYEPLIFENPVPGFNIIAGALGVLDMKPSSPMMEPDPYGRDQR